MNKGKSRSKHINPIQLAHSALHVNMLIKPCGSENIFAFLSRIRVIQLQCADKLPFVVLLQKAAKLPPKERVLHCAVVID